MTDTTLMLRHMHRLAMHHVVGMTGKEAGFWRAVLTCTLLEAARRAERNARVLGA